MPKFIITTVEGGHLEDVFDNVDFPSEKAATDDAQRALAEMAKNHLPDGKGDAFGVMVSDEQGNPIYRAIMEFRAEDADDIRAEQKRDDVRNRSRALHAALRGQPWADVERAWNGDFEPTASGRLTKK